MSVLFAFFHHILAFTLVSTLAIEFVLIRGELNLSAAKKLQFTDTIYGISAGLLIIVGILRVVYFEKGVYYYLHSHSFYAKMAAFVFVGIASIYPTVVFLSWRRLTKQGLAPIVSQVQLVNLKRVITFELFGIAVIFLGAAMMAKGV